MSSTLLIPSDERQALVRSFWLTLTGLAMVPWLTLAWWLHMPLFAVVLVGVVPVLCLVVREAFVWRVYLAWNRRVVRPFNVLATRAVLALCFFVLFVAVGKAGTQMSLTGTAGARGSWLPRASRSPDTSRALEVETAGSFALSLRTYAHWTRQSGNRWAVMLIPFIAVLTLLSSQEQSAPPAGVYTLF